MDTPPVDLKCNMGNCLKNSVANEPIFMPDEEEDETDEYPRQGTSQSGVWFQLLNGITSFSHNTHIIHIHYGCMVMDYLYGCS